MGEVRVCILMCGEPSYFWAGRQAASSVLERSDFDLFLALGPGPDLRLHANPRLRCHPLAPETGYDYRARPFLRKFYALRACLESGEHPWLMVLDADAILVRTLTRQMLEKALAGRGLGMVEQTTILRSAMGRPDFLEHYVRHTLAWFAPNAVPPRLDEFRYYNSGVLLGRREALQEVVSWALDTLDRNRGDHTVGEHMIADQDYYQFWTNTLRPESCAPLPWYWNHCEHWDEGFPHPEAYILHFSNFCRKPTLGQVMRMRILRRYYVAGKKTLRLPGRLLGRKVFLR